MRKRSRRRRFSRQGRRQSQPPRISVGEIYDVTIQGLNRRGQGIAKINGMTVFVPNTRVGDRVPVRITRIFRGFAIAHVIQ